MFSTNGQYYSPEDQLAAERRRLTPSNADQSACKRRRLYYEGEPDTSKWALPPAPEIRSLSSPPTSMPEGLQDAPPIEPTQEQDVAALTQLDSLSTEVLQQIANLCTAQHDFERRLFEHRKRIQHEHERALRQLDARSIVESVDKERSELLREHKYALERADRRVVEKMDELRYQQQMQLHSWGVPGIYPSPSISALY
ncbi:hypothetical protein GGI15_001784 [Coemansia interrupta]|uniref:Uncharacterized protein n=1 Tax=Coemansia interrupta TaxID=1126814 RepID=A0A9W8HH84_9FUNG|nr:hypothetical protein GGI15_001784 [Coemansia interrupta]